MKWNKNSKKYINKQNFEGFKSKKNNVRRKIRIFKNSLRYKKGNKNKLEILKFVNTKKINSNNFNDKKDYSCAMANNSIQLNEECANNNFEKKINEQKNLKINKIIWDKNIKEANSDSDISKNSILNNFDKDNVNDISNGNDKFKYFKINQNQNHINNAEMNNRDFLNNKQIPINNINMINNKNFTINKIINNYNNIPRNNSNIGNINLPFVNMLMPLNNINIPLNYNYMPMNNLNNSNNNINNPFFHFFEKMYLPPYGIPINFMNSSINNMNTSKNNINMKINDMNIPKDMNIPRNNMNISRDPNIPVNNMNLPINLNMPINNMNLPIKMGIPINNMNIPITNMNLPVNKNITKNNMNIPINSMSLPINMNIPINNINFPINSMNIPIMNYPISNIFMQNIPINNINIPIMNMPINNMNIPNIPINNMNRNIMDTSSPISRIPRSPSPNINSKLDPKLLNNLPSTKIKNNSKILLDKKECVICLQEYKAYEYITSLPCIHVFHTKCIKSWLLTKNECPICKFIISNETISFE